jgi:hypothetical protein
MLDQGFITHWASAMADNRGCAKLGHFHLHCTFSEFNTILKIVEILRDISFHVSSIIMILDVFKCDLNPPKSTCVICHCTATKRDHIMLPCSSLSLAHNNWCYLNYDISTQTCASDILFIFPAHLCRLCCCNLIPLLYLGLWKSVSLIHYLFFPPMTSLPWLVDVPLSVFLLIPIFCYIPYPTLSFLFATWIDLNDMEMSVLFERDKHR